MHGKNTKSIRAYSGTRLLKTLLEYGKVTVLSECLYKVEFMWQRYVLAVDIIIGQ